MERSIYEKGTKYCQFMEKSIYENETNPSTKNFSLLKDIIVTI